MSTNIDLIKPRGNPSDLQCNMCVMYHIFGHVFCPQARNDRLICVKENETATQTHVPSHIDTVYLYDVQDLLMCNSTKPHRTESRPGQATSCASLFQLVLSQPASLDAGHVHSSHVASSHVLSNPLTKSQRKKHCE